MLSLLPSYPALFAHKEVLSRQTVRSLFDEDSARFDAFHRKVLGWTFDFSKHRVTRDTLALFCVLGREAGVEAARDAMFRGEAINVTEHRAVLHTALRLPRSRSLLLHGTDVVPQVHAVLAQMEGFVESLHAGALKGSTGKSITDIVNIGIGGSDLGPVMTVQALFPFRHANVRVHFVSNVDRTQLALVLRERNPETTLFIIASKTFTTQETMTNAHSAKAWLADALGVEFESAKHFAAVSTNLEAAAAFGVAADRVFGFWDWVGGRYSIWSSIGLPLACSIGMQHFREFLAGAHAVDEHFVHTRLEDNVPFLMAMLGVWCVNVLGAQTHAVLPYDQYLARFPAYLQQADMESNGKSVSRAGLPIADYETGPVIFGEPGTNGQHAFYQLIHQGTKLVPADFIVPLRSHSHVPGSSHQAKLVAHCFAQSQALMEGRTLASVLTELRAKGVSEAEAQKLAPHRVFSGNRPSSMFVTEVVTPEILGQLIALYEHKIFVQGILWDTYSFDQWGVELGKVLAGKILSDFDKGTVEPSHDGSTQALIRMFQTQQPAQR
jgi:glucose-6-phosphate isomerase